MFSLCQEYFKPSPVLEKLQDEQLNSHLSFKKVFLGQFLLLLTEVFYILQEKREKLFYRKVEL